MSRLVATLVIASPAFAWPLRAVAEEKSLTLQEGETRTVEIPRRCLRVNSLAPDVVEAVYQAPKMRLTAKKAGSAQVICEDAASLRFILNVTVVKPPPKDKEG